MDFFFLNKWQIAFGCLAGRKRACSSSVLFPLTSDRSQGKERKDHDEEEEILAIPPFLHLLLLLPSLLCLAAPGDR